jgi:hypothetical protein
MNYLLELNEYGDEKKIDRIISRIKSVGYISTSNKRDLEKITGIDNIADIILTRVNQINRFYTKYNDNFFKKTLSEFFEESNYTYNVSYGLYLSTSSHYSSFYTSHSEGLNRLLPNSFFMEDKNSVLLSLMIGFVSKETNISYIKSFDDREKRKQDIDYWNRNYRSRHFNYANYFKYIKGINPYIEISVVNKDSEKYWSVISTYNADHFKFNGWTPDVFNSQKNYSVSEVIVNKLKNFTEMQKVNIYSGHTSYTLSDDLLRINDNRYLLSGKLTYKFILPDS